MATRVPLSSEPESKLSPNEEAFWKAYIFSLQEEIMPNRNPDQIFFPALQSTVGVLAGANVPDEITNYGVYQWADGAMFASQPLYLGGEGSYITNLERYLKYVDVGSNPSRGLFEAYLAAVRHSTEAKKNYSTEFKQALDLFKEDPSANQYPTIDEWAVENYPSFNEAKQAMQSAVGREKDLRLQMDGPAADQKQRAIDNIQLAINTKSEPGFNMPTTADNVQLDDEQSLDLARGQKVDFPPFVKISRPAYSIQGEYKSFVSECAANMAANQLQPKSIKLDVERFENAMWENGGFTNVTGEGLVGYFIDAFAEYKRKDEFQKTFNEMTANDYEVTLDIYGQRIYQLKTGKWDVPDVVRVFPNLYKGAPEDLMDFFQPKEVAIAYTTGLHVQFRDRYAAEFNSHFKSIEEEEGGFVIFGIAVELGGKRESSTEKTTHKATYDESTGTLTVHPNNDGRATLLGMVGQRANPSS